MAFEMQMSVQLLRQIVGVVKDVNPIGSVSLYPRHIVCQTSAVGIASYIAIPSTFFKSYILHEENLSIGVNFEELLSSNSSLEHMVTVRAARADCFEMIFEDANGIKLHRKFVKILDVPTNLYGVPIESLQISGRVSVRAATFRAIIDFMDSLKSTDVFVAATRALVFFTGPDLITWELHGSDFVMDGPLEILLFQIKMSIAQSLRGASEWSPNTVISGTSTGQHTVIYHDLIPFGRILHSMRNIL